MEEPVGVGAAVITPTPGGWLVRIGDFDYLIEDADEALDAMLDGKPPENGIVLISDPPEGVEAPARRAWRSSGTCPPEGWGRAYRGAIPKRHTGIRSTGVAARRRSDQYRTA